MSDEQTIYISPEDDLTTVRERLEQIPARRLTMVIPPQTQLRSYVAWKLLHARARELSKEVIIVSSDPQVRSVAHAVKFRVAHSLETSPATGKSRSASRPGRTSNSGGARTRTSPPLSSRPPAAKDSSASRSAHNQHGASNTQTPHFHMPEAEWHKDPQSRQQAESEDSGTFSEEIITGEIPHTLAFDVSEKQYNQSYDFAIHPSPVIHPLSDQIEEPDLLVEDYELAQDIRSAAREGQKHSPEVGIVPETRPEEALSSSSTVPQSDAADEPFTDTKDSHPPQTEQTEVVSLEGLDTNEHMLQDFEEVADLSDSPIEFRGDRDDIVPPPSHKPITYTEAEQAADDGEQETPPRIYGVPSRRRRSSNLPPTPSISTPSSTWQFEEDALPPVEEHPIQPRSSAPSQPRMSGARSPGKIPSDSGTLPRTGIGRGQQPPTRSTMRPAQQRLGSGASRTRTRPRQEATRGKTNRKIPVAAVVGILLLFAACLLVYYGPTANVAVGIAMKDYSHQVTLMAKVDKQAQGDQTQQLSKAEIVTNNFSTSGTGTATGSQLVGTNPAQGNVIFTYNGSNPHGIVIPSGSIITTSGDNPIEFTTTTEVLVLPSNQNKVPPPPISIQAVKPGQDGNVDAGTITVIPPTTLNTIAQQQNPPIAVSDVNLSVVNQDPTTGGGAKPTPAVTDQDLTKVKNDLHQQLQGKITAWQQQLSRTGAIGSPQTTDTLINAPKVNDIAANGTFSATLKVTATVLLVPTADLQKEALKQLNEAIKHDTAYAGDAIFTDSNPTVSITQLKQTAADANSITFTFNATAKATPKQITKEYVQQLVTGKSIPDARTALINTPDVKTADITVSPGFMPWVSLWNEHIDVTIHPATGTAPHQTRRS